MGSDTQTCIHCGDPLSGRQTKFCSRRCHDIHPKAYDPAKIRSSYKARTCEVCGVTYHPTYGAQRTCGRLCGKILVMVTAGKPLSMPRLHGQHTGLMVCPVCGKRIEKKNGRVCCATCSHIRALERDRATQPRAGVWRDGAKFCSVCDAPIPVYKGSGNLCGVCSDKRHRALEREYRRITGNGNHRKRARFYGCEYEPVNKRRVFERDEHRCHICGRKTTLKGKPWAPRRATLDHLIPLSKGGAHSYVNVACACFECNSLKSAGVGGEGDQLRLLG